MQSSTITPGGASGKSSKRCHASSSVVVSAKDERDPGQPPKAVTGVYIVAHLTLR